MIRLERVRELVPFRAASGLIMRGNRVIVIADDSFVLATFSMGGDDSAEFRTLLSGELPDDFTERKRLKPDFECLFEYRPEGGEKAILALPSGSKSNRYRGAILEGEVLRELDFRELFARLRETIPNLNIEGALETDSGVALFHRGNSAGAENAVIRVARKDFEDDLRTGEISGRGVREVTTMPLGEIDGIRLTFGDAALDSQGRGWFLASAEATEDAYLDGRFLGAVLGRLDRELKRVEECRRIDCGAKPEGLAFDPLDDRTFYVVTDADDPEAVSGLFRGRLD